MQLVCTFSDDAELNQLRAVAASLRLCQVGRVNKRTFFKKVRFVSIEADDSNSKADENGTK